MTDRAAVGGRRLEDVVTAAVSGGAAYVQLREKEVSTRRFVDVARRMRGLLVPHHVPLIINDRVDVACAVEADGVHLGQDDLPYPTARALLGPDRLVGLSVETMADVLRAESYDVDYLGVSPIFPTPTKTDTRGHWGLGGLAEVRRRSRHDLVAIGGLNSSNAADAIRAGADAVAVVSAICAAADPEKAAARLARLIDDALGERGTKVSGCGRTDVP